MCFILIKLVYNLVNIDSNNTIMQFGIYYPKEIDAQISIYKIPMVK